jgi:nitrite transporter NirC
MYQETVEVLSQQAQTKLKHQNISILSHLVRSMMAGMYVGAAIVLIFTIGGTLTPTLPGLVRMLMGICFGGALTLVIFAGSELFTGSNLILGLGVLNRKASFSDLLSNWGLTWFGNLIGGITVAYLVVAAGLMDADPVKSFVLGLVEKKMNLTAQQLFIRAILANWLVCLAVWMSARVQSETARILLIFWCMFTFITSGYEHSVANMCGLMLGLLLPHGATISLAGYGYNLLWTSLGNIVGGMLFVGGFYWLGSPGIWKSNEMLASKAMKAKAA